MTDGLWQEEAERILDEKFRCFCHSLQLPLPASALRIAPALSPWEAGNLVRGLEQSLFELDSEGNVRSSALAIRAEENADPAFPIFEYEPAPPRLRREVVCQLSAAAVLILDRGWLTSQIEIKTPVRGYHSPNDVDLLIRSVHGDLLAAVMVKRTAPELDKLKRDLRQCGKRGSHPQDNCGFPQNHATYEFCASQKPLYLWAVAPDGETCVRLDYRDNGVIELQDFESLPPRSLFELI